MQHLRLLCCGINSTGAQALGSAIGRGFLPALRNLDIQRNYKLGNTGVTNLVQGLQASSRIKLEHVNLSHVGMGNVGLKSLADAIRSGAFFECRSLGIGASGPLGNVSSLVDALRSGGLRNLIDFSTGSDDFDPKDVVILARSLMEHSSALKCMSLPNVEEDDRKIMREIRDRLGRTGTLEIRVGDDV